jgi:hypothetical protein
VKGGRVYTSIVTVPPAHYVKPSVVPVAEPEPPEPPAPDPTLFYIAPSGSDNNPGSSASPWQTVTHAVDTLTAGQTGIVRDGTYTEPQIVWTNSGTYTAPITLRAENPHQAIIMGRDLNNPYLSSYGSYQTVDGLRFTPSPNPITAPRLYIGMVRAWNSLDSTLSSPGSGTVGFVLRNSFFDKGGVLVACKSNQDLTIMEDNEVHDQLEVFNGLTPVIRRNILHGGGVITKGGTRGVVVANNTLYYLTGDDYGLNIGGGANDATYFDPPSGVLVYDADVYGNTLVNQSGLSGVPLILFRSAQNCTAHHNTVTLGELVFAVSSYLNIGNPGSTFVNNTVDGVLVQGAIP